jgi:hypothetical protein
VDFRGDVKDEKIKKGALAMLRKAAKFVEGSWDHTKAQGSSDEGMRVSNNRRIRTDGKMVLRILS